MEGFIITPKDLLSLQCGLATGLQAPTARGTRFVLLHVDGKEVFIENRWLLFLANKNYADYHSEMDSYLFEKWFR